MSIQDGDCTACGKPVMCDCQIGPDPRDAEIAKLRAALKPFAEYAEKRDANPLRGLADVIHAIHSDAGYAEITLTDCRAAAKALGAKS